MTTITNKKIDNSFKLENCPALEKHFNYMQEKVGRIIERMGLEPEQFEQNYGCDELLITANPNIFGPSKVQYTTDGSHSQVRLLINPLELIDPKEIPSAFHITDIEDPRLDEEEFLTKFILWLSDYLKIEDFSFENLSSPERKEIKCFLRLTRNPKLFRKAVKGILAHELSHLFHKHLLVTPYTFSNQSLIKILGGIAFLGTAHTCISSGNYSFFEGAFNTLLGMGATVLTSAGLTLRAWSISREQEFEADEKACTTLKSISGLSYYFDTKDKHLDLEMKKWSANFKGNTCVKKIGATLLPFLLTYPPTHPASRARVENLQKLKNITL